MSVPPLLDTIAAALDSLAVAFCAFDADDRTLAWNRSFLDFFPEHEGEIRAGEPYRDNLRRFYAGRLAPEEQPLLERFVDEGLARHRAQDRPFSFEHRGRLLRVASLPLPDGGRLRIWKDETPAAGLEGARGTGAEGAEMFDHIAEGVMVADADGRIVWVNDPFVALYGLAGREQATGVGFETVYRRAWGDAAAAEPGRFAAGLGVLAEQLRFAGAPFEVPLPGERASRVVEQRTAGGRRYFVHVDISTLKRQQRELADAETRARASEAALREQTRLLEATLERMDQGVMMVNPDRIVEVCNRRAIELLELPPELMRSRPRFEEVLAYQWSRGEFARTPPDLQAFVRAGGILDQPQTYDRQRPDGRVIEVHSVPIAGGGVLRTYTDITERRRSEERIRHLARHDGLTALVNREVFVEHLAGALAQPAGGAEAGRIAVHFIDLDGFKPVNDRHGHLVGDKVLAIVAERLRRVARESDIVARLGGDEFAILQFRVEAEAAALGLAQRVVDTLRRPIEVDAHRVGIGASVGIAFAAPGASADALLREADAAMYAAKAAGGHGVRVHRGAAA